MSRLGIIGNSYTGALKVAWDSVAADYPDWTLEFFASPFLNVDNYLLRDGALIALDEVDRYRFSLGAHGAESVVLADFDALAVVGFDFSIPGLARRFATHRPYDLATPGMQLISKSCLEATVLAAVQRTAGLKMARLLRSATRVPLIVIGAPLCSAGIFSVSDELLAEWQNSPQKKFVKIARLYEDLTNAPLQCMLYAAWRTAWKSIEAQEPLSFLPQPEETIVDGCYTAEHFSREPVGMGGHRKPTSDMFHMNGDFGKPYIANLIAGLKSQPLAECAGKL